MLRIISLGLPVPPKAVARLAIGDGPVWPYAGCMFICV